MDLVGMCCPAHSVCLPTSANACTARNTATLDVHCACASPTSLYRALRNSTMYEYSLPVGQHFTRGMNSTHRPAVLQGSYFPNAGWTRVECNKAVNPLHSQLDYSKISCLTSGILVWTRFSLMKLFFQESKQGKQYFFLSRQKLWFSSAGLLSSWTWIDQSDLESFRKMLLTPSFNHSRPVW